DYLRGSWDFIGVNYYTRTQTTPRLDDPKVLELMMSRMGETTDMYEVFPEGFYRQLMSVKKYGKPVYVTENGIATRDDNQRCRFILVHLREVHRAIRDGVDLKGYIYWSLLDNFEWSFGFSMRFGLIEVDFETLERKPRPSAYLYRDIIKSNKITAEQFRRYLS
ncbi:MAG: family 1 glycosylhydrolase, partial [Candidatus Freyrarchaeum guaymaensis]